MDEKQVENYKKYEGFVVYVARKFFRNGVCNNYDIENCIAESKAFLINFINKGTLDKISQGRSEKEILCCIDREIKFNLIDYFRSQDYLSRLERKKLIEGKGIPIVHISIFDNEVFDIPDDRTELEIDEALRPTIDELIELNRKSLKAWKWKGKKEKYFRVVKLFCEGMTLKEIGKNCGVTEGRVCQMLKTWIDITRKILWK